MKAIDRQWIGEASGPLILVPVRLLPRWSGIDVPSDRIVGATFRWNAKESRASDYDRACDVTDYAAVIAVGEGEGLVLSEGQVPTTWVRCRDGGILARWEYAEDDAAMDRAIDNIPETLMWEPTSAFHLATRHLELFNAAEPGNETLMSRLAVDLSPGRYDVHWARLDFDSQTALSLVRLRLSNDA